MSIRTKVMTKKVSSSNYTMIAMQLTSEGEACDKSIVSPSLVSCAETKSKWAINGAGLSA